MKKIVFSIALLGGISANAQQLLEVLKPHTDDTKCIPPSGYNFTPSEKCLELVCDRNYGDGEHDFIYCAVQGPNGKKWLKHNLGAEFTNIHSSYFLPEATPVSSWDWRAFGSQFQYGRGPDGHELGKYYPEFDPTTTPQGDLTRKWSYERKYKPTTNRIFYDYNKNNKSVVKGTYWFQGLLDYQAAQLWQQQTRLHNFERQNPCPLGYIPLTEMEAKSFITDKINDVSDTSFAYRQFGERGSTSLIYHIDNPNLYLMMSPIMDERTLDTTNPNMSKGSTRLSSDEAGTSGLHLSYDHKNTNPKYYAWSIGEKEWQSWENYYEYDGRKYPYIDWGGIIPGASWGSSVLIGVNDWYDSAAVRCVEK